MDDLKLLHIDKKVVDEMVKWMKGLYGQDMIISIGKKHDYLGIVLDFSVRRQVAVTIVYYLNGSYPVLREWKYSPVLLHHQPQSIFTLS